jgi:hypothetical protein
MSFNCFQHAICVEATYGWFANLKEANVQIVENVGMFDFGNPPKTLTKTSGISRGTNYNLYKKIICLKHLSYFTYLSMDK